MSAYRAIFWSFLTQYASFALSFAISIVLARLLGPKEMGIFSVAAALTIFLQNIQGFSLNQFIVREAELRPSHLRTAFGISIALSAMFSAVLLAGAQPIADFYHEPRVRSVLYVLIAANVLFPIGLPAQAVLMREMRYRALFLVNISAVVVSAGVSVWLATLGYGALAQGAFVFVQAVVKSALLLVFKPDQIRLRPSFEDWREMTGFGSRMMGITLTGSAMGRAPELIIGRLVDLASVGLYSRAAGITDQAFQLLYPGGGGALFSVLSRFRNEGRDMSEPYFKAVSHFTGTIWAAFFALSLVAEPLINLLYGAKWLAAARILQWLCLSQAILSAAVTHYEMPVIFRRPDLLLKSEAAHLSIGLPLFAACTWAWGLEGAAIGRVVHAALFAGFNLLVLRRLLGFSLRALALVLLRCLGSTFVAGLPALAARLLWRGAEADMPFPVMLAAGVLTGPAWLLGLKLVGHPLYAEVAAALRQRLARFRTA